MLVGTVADYDIPGTLVVSILVAADISAGVGILIENSNDTSPNRKLYHPCVLVYKIPLLSTAVPGICYAGTTSYLVLVRTCIPGRLKTYSSMYRFFFLMGGLIRQGPCHGVACEIHVVWCIYVVLWKLRCASNVIFSSSLVNLTVLREICAPLTHPTRGVRVTRTHPSRIP